MNTALQPPSYIRLADISPEMYARLLAEAAVFYSLRPWERLRQEIPLGVRLGKAGAERLVVLMGAAAEAYGLIVLSDWSAYTALKQAQAPQDLTQGAGWLALSFEGPEMLAEADLVYLDQMSWPYGSLGIFPALARFGPPEPGLHPPRVEDVAWLAGVLPALNVFFRNYLPPTHAPKSEQEFSVEIQTGAEPVALRFPFRQEGS